MSDLIKISSNLGSFLSNNSPQVKDNTLNWYFAGSLSSMIMGDALEYSEVVLDESNNIVALGNKKTINKTQREKIQTFKRKLGGDIDIVNVNGYMYGGAPRDKKPAISLIKENIDNVTELIPTFEYIGGSGYIDNLDFDRDINNHNVSMVTTSNGVVLMTSPPEQISFKIKDLLVIHDIVAKGNKSESVILHYKKDFRDLIAMLYGFKDLYIKEEMFERIAGSLSYELNEDIIKNVIHELDENMNMSSDLKELVEYLNELLLFVCNRQRSNSK